MALNIVGALSTARTSRHATQPTPGGFAMGVRFIVTDGDRLDTPLLGVELIARPAPRLP